MTADPKATPDPVVDAVDLMRTLADPTRLRLLGLLQSGPMNVSALCERLGLAQPTVSHHLGLLRALKLVNNRRDGKQVFYSLNPETARNMEDPGGLTVAIGPVEVRFLGPVSDRERSPRVNRPAEAVPEVLISASTEATTRSPRPVDNTLRGLP